LLLLPVAFGQSTSLLRGTVYDTTGGVIPGAAIELRDSPRGIVQHQKSGSEGAYQFLQLPPGRYEVTVRAAGFREETLAVTLVVSTPATLDLKLEVAAAGTKVEVTAAAPLVNSADATLGNDFDEKQLLSLPSEGRNAVEILSLQPGVTYVGNQVDPAADSRGGSVNGARSDQTNITVDGLDNNDQLLGNAFTGVLRIPMDSIEEFRVITTNANADTGRSSGAQVSLVTKTGTNSTHGTLYEYNRPTIGVANDWFNKKRELDAGLPNEPGRLIRNTFGAAVGGPVIHNRLFFFGNYEGQRARESQQVTQLVPTATLRKGIIGYVCDPSADAKCAVGTPGVSQSSLVPSGTLLAQLSPSDLKTIDQGCLSSGTCPQGNGVSQAVLNLWNGLEKLPNGASIPAYPLPNTNAANGADGINIGGYTFAAPTATNLDTYLLRADDNITQNGNHRLFLRGNMQNDLTLNAPQFPGEPPASSTRDRSKGIAAGYTAVLGPAVINNFRYALVRQSIANNGGNNYPQVGFWILSDPVSFQKTTDVSVPVHQFVDDVTWTKGKHTVQFGGNWRIVSNNRLSDANNSLYASMHPTWFKNGGIAGTGQDLDPSISSVFPAVDANFAATYDAAVTDVAGLLGSISATYNQTKSGLLPLDSMVPRHFRANELEFYGQDAWRVTSHFQLTFGLRYTLLQPPYERDGNQVSPDPSLSSFFAGRENAMNQGQTYRPVISFALSGPANGGQPYWGWDFKDVAPRLGFAYSPNADSGFWHRLFGASGKSSIRGGFGLYYDHFGEGVVNSFDRLGSLGLTTFLENPSTISTTNCVVRFVSLTTIPTSNGCPVAPGGPPVPELPAQPKAGFPYTPPGMNANGSFAIGWGIDNTLKTPYSWGIDFAITRELPSHFVLELAYVGRLSRRLLQEVDMAQPLNIRDPKSGMTYYQAATLLSQMAGAKTSESKVAPIPYWQDMFPAAAGPAGISGYAPGTPTNPTATQNIYDLYYGNLHNEALALQTLDTTCFPACSILGPFAYYDDQFASAFGWRSTGFSNYNALEITLRRQFGALHFDFNYTYSKSLDTNSNAERINEYENGSGPAVAYSGQVVNAWSPNQLYGPSDYDLRHQINANWVYDLPVGHGMRWGKHLSRTLDSFFGEWELSGLVRWTSGYPFSVSTYEFPTNFEQDSKAILIGAAPKTGTYFDSQGDPNVFAAGPDASSAFRYAYPGESGQRNNLRGPGYFGVDSSLSKSWHISESQLVRFSWDVFNTTNAVRFDVGTVSNYLYYQPSLGKFTQTLTRPRVMQFGLRYTF
jgi:outer membrane receptor protein involved in Fe transport